MSFRDLPTFRDIRAFLEFLDTSNQLRRVTAPVSTVHEMTEIHHRVLETRGPALLFEKASIADGATASMPVLVNLFGSIERVAWGLGVTRERISMLGELLARLRQPEPIDGFKGLRESWPLIKAALREFRSQVHLIPLHRQMIPWATRANVTVVHRPDNWFELRWASVAGK